MSMHFTTLGIIFQILGRVVMQKKRGIIKYIVLIIIFIVVALALVAFFNTRATEAYIAPTRPVEVMRPERRTLRDTIELTGYIEADAMIPVVPFVSGTIEEYLIKAGDYVEKDEVIAEIDKEPYELQRAQAEAAYLGVESSFKRVESLYERGAATEQDYEMLKAQLAAAKAQLELAELQLSYATLTSPISGTVLIASSSSGSIASTQSPLAIIADLDDLVVNVKVGERYFNRIREKLEDIKVIVTSGLGGESEAEIVSVSPYIDPTSKTFAMKVHLDSPSAFTPGMFVHISLVLDERECYALPSYVSMADGSVYALSESGDSAVYINLEKGLEEGSWFEIPDEYASMLFISRGLDGIVSGMPVSVVGGLE